MNFDLLDRGYFVRRVLFVWLLVVATWIIWWMLDYAKTSPRSGQDVALICGAINVPITWLVGKVLTAWKDVQPSEGQQ